MITEDEVVKTLAQLLPSTSFTRQYVEHAGACCDSNIGYHVAGALSILTQTAPMMLHIPLGTKKWSNFYSLVIGPSTKSRKTEAVTVATEILKEAIPTALGEEPGSEEGLKDSIRENPRQLLMYPEFGAFLAGAERGYMTQLKARFTSLYDCSPLGRATVKERKGNVPHPRLSIFAASTLDFLERHSELVDWTSGFLGRFYTFLGERHRTYRVQPAVNPIARKRIIELVQTLSLAPDPLSLDCPCLGFSQEAEALLGDWQDSIERRCADAGGVPREVAPAVGRAPGMAIKIALLMAWDFGAARQNTGPWYIEAPEVAVACAMTDWHVASVLQVGSRLAASKDMRDRRIVLEAVGKMPTALGEITKASKMLKWRAKQILETLLEEKMIEMVPVAQGRIGEWYQLAIDPRSVPNPDNVVQLRPRAMVAELPPLPLEAAPLQLPALPPLPTSNSGANGASGSNAGADASNPFPDDISDSDWP